MITRPSFRYHRLCVDRISRIEFLLSARTYLFKWYYWSSSDFDDFVKITDRIRSTGINNFVFTEYTFVCIGVVKNREEVYNFHFYHSHFDLPLYPYFTGNSPIYRSNHLCVVWGAVMGLGIGLALRNGLSSGSIDIVSITIRKKTGKSIGSISSTSMH